MPKQDSSNSQTSILLVDDDRQLLQSMGGWLNDQGYQIFLADNAQSAYEQLEANQIDLAMIDLRLGSEDGMEVLKKCRLHHPKVVALLMTGYATVDTGIEAIRAGAFDLLTKPLIDEELLLSIDRALSQQQVIEENKQLKAQLDDRFSKDNIVGNDTRMQKTFDIIDSIADTRATVLITGQSGTGKSMRSRQACGRIRP